MAGLDLWYSLPSRGWLPLNLEARLDVEVQAPGKE